MKLYFDSNIYGFISEKREDIAFRQFLDENGHTVEASSGNLFEIYHIPDREKCKQTLQTLTSVASFYESKPQSWHQAQEVLNEIKRHRSYWFRQPASPKLIEQEKKFLRSHRENWERAKEPYLKPDPVTAQYRKDYEEGVTYSKLVQKTLKQRLLENDLQLSLVSQTKDDLISEILTDNLLDADLFWRVNNLLSWFEAISRRSPSSRDYADWLLPYIRDNAFKTRTLSYSDFWMKQVREEKVPKNRITALVDFYQMKHKITHGNAGDQMHACHMLDVDVFATADKAYYQVLREVKNHFTNCANVVFLKRGAESAIDEIKNALASQEP